MTTSCLFRSLAGIAILAGLHGCARAECVRHSDCPEDALCMAARCEEPTDTDGGAPASSSSTTTAATTTSSSSDGGAPGDDTRAPDEGETDDGMSSSGAATE